MNRQIYTATIAALVCALLLTGCGPKQAVRTMVITSPAEVGESTVITATPAATQVAHAGDESQVPPSPNRLIVKNAEIKLLVTDTGATIDRTTQIASDVGGYIVSSRVWYQKWLDEKYQYATMTIAVPVDQFETALHRLRDLAVLVEDETVSGQDVTDEYVDLQSRLESLQATRSRILDFLEQAKTVKEALQVNQELTAVETQIEQVQGRMNYLFDRAAYSTITVQIEPELPSATPSPAQQWNPSQTFREAGHALGSIFQALAEISIWLGVVVVPIATPLILIGWLIRRMVKSRRT